MSLVPSLSTALASALSLFGLAALAIVALLAMPLRRPPPLASILEGAMKIGAVERPELSRFQARDGSWLAYRFYPAVDGAADRLAILVHGSSASSDSMNEVARALARAGVATAAIDARGHGASGTRGDVGYLGQLDDDLADLVAELRSRHPEPRPILIGHSSGGGFALRIASGPMGKLFGRFVLLAPYLGPAAPTSRPSRWAIADVPRIIAIGLLTRLGVDWAQAMPVIAFAIAPDRVKFVTPRYSWRLLSNFAAPWDWKRGFAATAAPIDVIVGDDDEMMYVDRYEPALSPYAATTRVRRVADVDHIGILHRPGALAAIVAAARQPAPNSSGPAADLG
ncbi:MAG: alpha/beta fold hydrolase [Roseiarcus sp.]|jgi:alpha-beta hydrolase superfamily lysophospholipase